jgi:hypothetical protein
MFLTGTQLASIQRAILGAFTRDELKRALRIGMDVSFDDYAPDKGFSDQVWALIEWAVRQDRVKELVRCAHENNPSNRELSALWRDVQRWDEIGQAPTSGQIPASGQNNASVSGSGAIAQQGGTAAGAGGIAIGGNFTGNIIIGGSPSDADPAHGKES